MPLFSRYLRSSQQISRFPKIVQKEKTARDRHRRNDGGDDRASCPRCGWPDHAGDEVAITSDRGPI
jgi:hypothetical protein